MTAKEQLLESARELIWERGYEAMSPNAVIKASGAGQGSLYHPGQLVRYGSVDHAAAAGAAAVIASVACKHNVPASIVIAPSAGSALRSALNRPDGWIGLFCMDALLSRSARKALRSR